MTHEQIETTKEAIAVLQLAHEYFDQAHALLKDANLHTSYPRGFQSAEYLNLISIPKLIEYLNECPDCGHPLTGHHPQNGCEHEFREESWEPGAVVPCGCKGEN